MAVLGRVDSWLRSQPSLNVPEERTAKKHWYTFNEQMAADLPENKKAWKAYCGRVGAKLLQLWYVGQSLMVANCRGRSSVWREQYAHVCVCVVRVFHFVILWVRAKEGRGTSHLIGFIKTGIRRCWTTCGVSGASTLTSARNWTEYLEAITTMVLQPSCVWSITHILAHFTNLSGASISIPWLPLRSLEMVLSYSSKSSVRRICFLLATHFTLQCRSCRDLSDSNGCE